MSQADIILLNKCDLPLDKTAVREAIARINPAAEVLEVSALTGTGIDAVAERMKARWKLG